MTPWRGGHASSYISAGILGDRNRDRGERVGLTGAAADATAMNERSLDPYTWSRTLEN